MEKDDKKTKQQNCPAPAVLPRSTYSRKWAQVPSKKSCFAEVYS